MKTQGMALAIVLAATALPASAEIIFQYGTAYSMGRYYSGGTAMPTLAMLPSSSISPQVSYQMQRARAWSNYRRGNKETGGALVFAPAFAENGGSSYGQALVRTHLSRANAYRLGYFK